MIHKTITSQEDYLRAEEHKKLKIRFYQVALFVILLATWELTSSLHIINPFIFSSPSRIIKCFCDMIVDKTLFLHIGVTLFETLTSFLLVILLSFFVAIFLWWNDTLSHVLEPYLVVFNSLPKSALAPILIVWLGNNMKTIIIAAISVAVFGSILNLYTGFCSVDPDKIKLIKTLKGTKLDCLKLVVIPSSIPLLLSIMKVNIGLSLVGVIIGEFLAARNGLGYLILYGSQVFKLDWVLMSIVLLCMMAMGLYSAINFAEKMYLRQF
ncbi:MAG: ABC transporter permease [Firmicutes bacterium]|uniref:ABC transporter permease n=1 Tax=Candidatus Scybalomonas excrementavium TaxID=2840943 RepID=A0A9D9HZN5_9FIRM|nr:ABC transporter permease [Candidatus Scybalomonas excrementavium]